MKARELRELTDEELRVRLRDCRDSLWRFRMQMTTGTVDNVRSARNWRRDIARILSIMGERARTGKNEAE